MEHSLHRIDSDLPERVGTKPISLAALRLNSRQGELYATIVQRQLPKSRP